MTAQPLTDLSRLAIHTMTNKPWSLRQCIDGYSRAGIRGISVWRNVLEPIGARQAGQMLRDAGMDVVALVRGGFFPAFEQSKRQAAIDDNRRAIDDAAEIGAKMVVLVCGAVPGMPLPEARKQIHDGIATVLPHAEAREVQLAIEPLHPMYAADRSAINRMAEARQICQSLRSPWLGIACDVYHVWWDPDLQAEIELAGKQKTLFAFHICDWRVETRDLLNDRGLMGEGCIPLRQIRSWVEAAGFKGYNEVEIFSTEKWALDQAEYVEQIKRAYLECS
ncbi:sugar phosphate isomerase/epimerase family protein [Fontivita pretiosa]|uniref:sugar phosphate isomerase/epimerase family protein n=1 Tax=Fontivita pretiosa TaxID=2989684 RepID=UPI003D168D3E